MTTKELGIPMLGDLLASHTISSEPMSMPRGLCIPRNNDIGMPRLQDYPRYACEEEQSLLSCAAREAYRRSSERLGNVPFEQGSSSSCAAHHLAALRVRATRVFLLRNSAVLRQAHRIDPWTGISCPHDATTAVCVPSGWVDRLAPSL